MAAVMLLLTWSWRSWMRVTTADLTMPIDP